MIAQATQQINWSPFSVKHKQYIHKAMKCKMSVAEGAIRSGKTIDNCIIAKAILEITPDKLHLASGTTVASAKTIIGDCNGFGLEHHFRGRCRWGKYKDNEALYIKTKTGEKIIMFVGGGKADSYKRILGYSFGLWIATEINEHYDCEDSRSSFIKVAFGRQVAAKMPKVLWDMNPSNPNAPIYTNYVDKYKVTYMGGYNYEHFTIDDNLSIDDERRREIISQYDPNTIHYKRDILGMRVIAEGLCYPTFADNPQRTFVNSEWLNKQRIMKITCGVDFGGDRSATTFVATAILNNYEYLIVLDSKRIKERLTSDRLSELFSYFVINLYAKFSRVFVCYCDSAESVLIHTLEKEVLKRNLQCRIGNALKKEINERIKATNGLIALDRFKILVDNAGDNSDIIESLSLANWDSTKVEKGDVRLDIVSFNNPVDILDAFEYSFEGDINKLIRRS